MQIAADAPQVADGRVDLGHAQGMSGRKRRLAQIGRIALGVHKLDGAVRGPDFTFASGGHEGDAVDGDLRDDAVCREGGFQADVAGLGGTQGDGDAFDRVPVAGFCRVMNVDTPGRAGQDAGIDQAGQPGGKGLFRILVEAGAQMLAPEDIAAGVVQGAENANGLVLIHGVKCTSTPCLYSIYVDLWAALTLHVPPRISKGWRPAILFPRPDPQPALHQPGAAQQGHVDGQVQDAGDDEGLDDQVALAHQAPGEAGELHDGDGGGQAGALDGQHQFVAVGREGLADGQGKADAAEDLQAAHAAGRGGVQLAGRHGLQSAADRFAHVGAAVQCDGQDGASGSVGKQPPQGGLVAHEIQGADAVVQQEQLD